jgi:hypothetical protein
MTTYETAKDQLLAELIIDCDYPEEDAIERVNDIYDEVADAIKSKIYDLIESNQSSNPDYLKGLHDALESL